MKKRIWVLGAIVVVGLVVMVMVVPVVGAAASDAQVLAVLGKVIEGVIEAGRDGYCAMGVTVFCP